MRHTAWQTEQINLTGTVGTLPDGYLQSNPLPQVLTGQRLPIGNSLPPYLGISPLGTPNLLRIGQAIARVARVQIIGSQLKLTTPLCYQLQNLTDVSLPTNYYYYIVGRASLQSHDNKGQQDQNQENKMDSIIEYDTVIALLGNSPSLDPRPNFFNLCKLRAHFARALKKLPCPQLAFNRWSGAVMSPPMYTLVDRTPFHFNIAPATEVADFCPCMRQTELL